MKTERVLKNIFVIGGSIIKACTYSSVYTSEENTRLLLQALYVTYKLFASMHLIGLVEVEYFDGRMYASSCNDGKSWNQVSLTQK
jgi:hypothetical protein